MFKRFEKIYAITALLYFAGALKTSYSPDDDPSTEGAGLPLMILKLFLAVVLLLVSCVNWRSMLLGVQRAGWLFAICALVLISAAWSSAPLYTLSHGAVFIVTTVFAIYLGSCFDWDEQLEIFGWVLALMVMGSILIVALYPEYGISRDSHFGDWKGLFGQKNILGRQMAFGILQLVIVRPKGMPALIRWATLIGGGCLLVLSMSVTSLISTTMILALYPALHIVRLRSRRTVPVWLALVPLLASLSFLVLANYSELTASVGRDATLTGRTSIWRGAKAGIRERPWLGYGYGAFWQTGEANDFMHAASTTGWHSHDGYLDLCLDLGLVGLLVFGVGYVGSARRALKLFQTASEPSKKWPLVYLLFFAIYNITESNILRTHSFFWIPYTSIFVAVALMESQESRAKWDCARGRLTDGILSSLPRSSATALTSSRSV